MTYLFETKRLMEWFLMAKRELPWRKNPTPYAVWVSEVMLQQTQVSVVIPYYKKWMLRFPSIKILAQASQDEVIKHWEGLGYYSRARNLHAGAQQIMQQYQGELPRNAHELLKIKGLGAYTVGAILNFAFHQRAAAVDGNVIRVLSRYFALEDDISKPSTLKNITHIAEKILPDKTPWIITEALIELGATVCKKSPLCRQCPVKKHCQGYLQGKAEQLPIKSKRIAIENLYRAVAVIKHEDSFLIQKGKKGRVMSDLHEFAYFELSDQKIEEREFQEKIYQTYQLHTTFSSWLPQEQHGFTRFRVTLLPALFHVQKKRLIQGFSWLTLQEMQNVAFSAGHRRVMNRISAENQCILTEMK